VGSFGAFAKALTAFIVSATAFAACSSGRAVSVDPCSLLKPSEIASAIHGGVDSGERVQAIGETERRMCSYRVTTALKTVTVYLGRGRPPHGSGTSWGGATATRGNAYVSVSAQLPDRGFSLLASSLAERAVDRSPTQ
jgi:hypothetical protein